MLNATRYIIFLIANTLALSGMDQLSQDRLPPECLIPIFNNASLHSQLQLAAICTAMQKKYNDRWVYYDGDITVNLEPRGFIKKFKNWWCHDHEHTAHNWTTAFCEKIKQCKIRGGITFRSITPSQLERFTLALCDNRYITRLHIMRGNGIVDYHMTMLSRALSKPNHLPLESFAIHHSLITYQGVFELSYVKELNALDVSDNPQLVCHLDRRNLEWYASQADIFKAWIIPAMSKVKKLSMVNCNIQNDQLFGWMPDFIEHNATLEELKLADNQLGSALFRLRTAVKNAPKKIRCDLFDEVDLGPTHPPCELIERGVRNF
jgi:hypothetical protein